MADFILKKKISRGFIEEATNIAKKGAYNKNSITNGERNMVGMLAELYVLDMVLRITDFDEDILHPQTFDYDIDLGVATMDVKTKQRTVAPLPHYAASIADYSLRKQMCDIYAFTSITVDRNDTPLDFYYIGHIGKTSFMSTSTFMKKGQPDSGNRRRDGTPFRITKDCWNLEYGKLPTYSRNEVQCLLDCGYELIEWK